MSDVHSIQLDSDGNEVAPRSPGQSVPLAQNAEAIQIGGASRGRVGSDGQYQDISTTGSYQTRGEQIDFSTADPLSFARDGQGSPVTSAVLKDSDVIPLPGGTDASIGSLIASGDLRRNPNGSLSWVPAQTQNQQQQQQQSPENAAIPVEIDAEHNAFFERGVERLGSTAVTSLAQAAIAGNEDAVLNHSAVEYSRTLGYETAEDFRADYTVIRDGLIAKGEEFLTSLGVKDTDALRTFATYDSEGKARYQEACLSYVDGDARPLERIARRYLASTR